MYKDDMFPMFAGKAACCWPEKKVLTKAHVIRYTHIIKR